MINLQKATLLIDKVQCVENIRAMVKKAKQHQLVLRPHFKTHQSKEIGQWFRSEGVTSIAVSSIEMAKYFASDQWNDITITVPVNKNQAKHINALASRIDLNIVVEDAETLRSIAAQLTSPVGVYIKIDTGLNRCGIPVENLDQILDLVREIKWAHHMIPKGLFTHAGTTHKASTVDDVVGIHAHSVSAMRYVKESLLQKYPSLTLSIGDTPSCKSADDFDGIHEIRPGTFLFNDCQQLMTQTCSIDELAMWIAAPVIGTYANRSEITIHCGAMHLSNDTYLDEKGRTSYGKLVLLSSDGDMGEMTDGYVSRVSQAQAVITCSDEILSRIQPGDFVGIIPAHCCLTNHLMKEQSLFLHFDKEGKTNDLRSRKNLYESL